ncbi:MAG TPA: NlpC/P60 family protein [Pseudonocardia sp.]|nr:NlpC/P60 family protein [Pseudonocardia sp.]
MPVFARSRRTTLALVAVAVGVIGIAMGLARDAAQTVAADSRLAVPVAGELHYQRLDRPARTIARTPTGEVVATMTDGARTIALLGPERIFADSDFTAATVTTTTWVRFLPQEWNPGAERQPWFQSWLAQALGDTSPDLFAVALQYLHGQPIQTDAAGLAYGGDAGFGPDLGGTGTREENSDFYDYLGVSWTFPDGEQETPDPARYRDVDCSGFLRLVLGYRMGYPLHNTNDPGAGLPRRAYAIAAFGPGTMIISDDGTTADDYSALQPGDLVFFNLDAHPQIDHAAIYLGLDNSGHHRFLSSRRTADGPTLGDVGGTSLLDDGGHYSSGFRTARRI